MNLTICPVCRAINVVHPGEPPSKKPYCFYNRCSCHALTGGPGKPGELACAFSFEKSWRKPQRSGNKTCGAPLTDEAGNVIPPIPMDEFIDITNKPFDVSLLFELAFGTDPK